MGCVRSCCLLVQLRLTAVLCSILRCTGPVGFTILERRKDQHYRVLASREPYGSVELAETIDAACAHAMPPTVCRLIQQFVSFAVPFESGQRFLLALGETAERLTACSR